MAQQNKESTETGGKVYSINLSRAGMPGSISGVNSPEMLNATMFREGTSGSPDDQGGVSPFGSANAGGPHIT